MDFLQNFKEIGLEDNEANVYLSLLKLSKASATEISKKSKIERTLSYKILEKLIERGLVTYIIENKKRYFYPSDPRKILEELKEKVHNFKEIIPQLTSLSEPSKEEKVRVEIYKGKDGLKNLIQEILVSKKDYLAAGAALEFEKVFPYFGKYLMKQLEKYKITERIILTEGTRVTLKSRYSQFRFLPREYPLPAIFGILENKVALIIWSDPFLGITIENIDLAKTFRSYFELLWKIAKK